MKALRFDRYDHSDHGPTDKDGRRRPHIVVIDDDPVFGRLMEAFGRQHGFDIRYCPSVRAATCLEQGGIDVLVVDYDMGVTNGLQLGREVELKLHAPVVLISHSQDALTAGDWPASVLAFVSKAAGPRAIAIAALQAYKDATHGHYVPPALMNDF